MQHIHLTCSGCAMPRRHCAADAAHISNPCEGISSALDSLSLDTALTDISNTLTAAAPDKGETQLALKARRGRKAFSAASSDLQGADSIVRCSGIEAAACTDGGAEHEADCILRAAPRRTAAICTSARRGRKMESPEAESADTSTEVADTDSEGELPLATVTAAKSARTLRLGRYKDGGSRQECSTADSHTPLASARRSGKGCTVVDENAVVATPAQQTTVRRASRFAAMQAPAAAAPLTELPRRAAARAAAPSTAGQPVRSRPSGDDQDALQHPLGKRGKSRVNFAAEPSSPEPALHMPSRQPQMAARKKPTGICARKGTRNAASVITRHSDAAEAGGAGEASCKGMPFVIHRAPEMGDAEGDVGEFGARMRALALEGDCLGGPSRHSASGGGATQHGPVLLVLDGELQSLPWESLPTLQEQGYSVLSLQAFSIWYDVVML